MQPKKFKLLILGGGTGGISLAARLVRHLGPGQIGIVEPASDHYYQPAWTLVGAGLYRKEKTRRPEAEVIPRGCTWLQTAVQKVFATENRVRLASGTDVHYDFLVVATGLRLNWESIAGLQGNLGQNGVCSIYEYDQVDKVRSMLHDFTGGTALFVMPAPPIKCAGAPQKIMYLADGLFRKAGVRAQTKIIFATAGKSIFAIPEFTAPLNAVLQRKGIEARFSHRLLSIDAQKKVATFAKTTETKAADGALLTATTEENIAYGLLHVVPTMSAHSYVAESNLACADGPQAGWLQVDMHTLQHPMHRNIFGIGDVTGVPNSKTGAAIRKQVPVVERNLIEAMACKSPSHLYDGYASCPLVTDKGRVILAEFGYNGKLLPTFPLNPTKERFSMWVLKRYLLPRLYWDGMLRGRA